MEVIKKTILQAVTTGRTSGGTVIIPDTGATYYVKIGLKQVSHDIGFFDATETEAPYPYGGGLPIGILNLIEGG